jgi:predicted transcriptional regulator
VEEVDILVVGLKFATTVTFSVSLSYGVKNYRATKSHTWLFLCMSLGTALLLSSIRLTKEYFYLYYDQFRPAIIVFELVKVSLIPFVTAFLLAAAITLSKERITTVLPTGNSKETTLDGAGEGTIYLIKSRSPEKGFETFLDYISRGHEGLCISRTYPTELRRKYNIDNTPIWWMSRLPAGDHEVIHPNLRFLEQRIEEILEYGKKVIFLERLDYLISQQGFRKTLQFIQQLSTLITITKSIVLVHIDPQTVKRRQLVLIEKETKALEDGLPKLEEELVKVLKYVYEENNRGIRPNITKVHTNLSLSKNTAKKRIKLLKDKNFLKIRKKGREKVLEITEFGKDFFDTS